jgi:hypothetical protein
MTHSGRCGFGLIDQQRLVKNECMFRNSIAPSRVTSLVIGGHFTHHAVFGFILGYRKH